MLQDAMDPVFIRACRKEAVEFTPIWLMRQAGRYMKEYRDVRETVPFLTLCKTPALACEVTVTAVRKLNVDAAIIFADILLITEPMGFSLEFHEPGGPVIHNPFRGPSDLARLQDPHPKESLSFVMEAIRLTKQELGPKLPVIGFAGAPFTVASYMIEGKSSRNFEHTKTLMRGHPGTWHALMTKISEGLTEYLLAQISAGATAIQLFDSWIGCLSPREYREYVLPHVQPIFAAIPKNIPAIHFGTGTSLFLEDFREAGGTVIGVDFHVPLDSAWKRLGDVAIQGNLDPTVLLSSKEVIEKEAGEILRQAGGRAGHIFNLGHGILPSTRVDHARRLIDFVHERTLARPK